MMRKIRTSALIFIMLALLVAPLSFGTLSAGAATADNGAEIEFRDEDGNTVEPVYVDGTEEGIMAISAEIDPESELAPQARVNGEIVPFDTLIYKVMQVRTQQNQQQHIQNIVIVGGTLSDQTPLPATIEVAVPAGSSVFWFGEVGDSGDPAQDPRFSGNLADMRRTEGEFDIYTATMTTYRDMQIEFRLTENPFTQTPDGEPTIFIDYIPWQDVRELRLAVALPPGGAVLDRSLEFLGYGPRDPETGLQSGAFARLITDAQAGELYSTEITFTVTGGGAADSNLNPLVMPILVAALVVVAGIMFFLFARGVSKRREEEYYDEDDYDYDDEDEDDE